MRKYSNIILTIINDSGLNLNSISKISGISNTYLTKLSKGRINHPGKDKIASILLALNYSITEVNRVLAEYDYQSLNKHDIPEIMKNNRRRKVGGRMLHHYDHLYFELILASFEHIGGNKVVVKNRPSGIYQPYDLYMMKEFPHEVDSDAAKFLLELTGAVVRERLDTFKANCRAGHKIITYMCRECLEDSLERNLRKNNEEKAFGKSELLAQYYANAISCALKFPSQHKLVLVERCAKFQFLIQDVDGENPKINFTGYSPHYYQNHYDQLNLEGFSTDAPAVISLFKTEIEMCKMAVNADDSRNTPKGFRDYVRAKFAKYGQGEVFDAALAKLMEQSEIVLY